MRKDHLTRSIDAFAILIGIGLSLYSLLHHIQVTHVGIIDAFCNVNSWFTCNRAVLSSFSEIYGIPLGLFGTCFFTLAGLMFGLSQWGPTPLKAIAQVSDSILRWTGALTTITLGSVSIFYLQSLCPVCFGVYIICLLRLALSSQIPNIWQMTRHTIVSTTISLGLMLGFVIAGAHQFQRYQPRIITWLLSKDQATIADKELAELLDLTKQHPELVNRKDIAENHNFMGPIVAPVILTEFIDLECPTCAMFHSVVKRLNTKYPDQLLIVARHFPLNIDCNPGSADAMHPNACWMAEVAECSRPQTGFWRIADYIFLNSFWGTRAELFTALGPLGIDRIPIERCLESKQVLQEIIEDAKLGRTLGLSATPGVFINGFRMQARISTPSIMRIIDLLLDAMEVEKTSEPQD